jgi:histidinol phosphatase-like PHP family hydrolase
MIAASELQESYRLVHGDPVNLQGRMTVADLHLHTAGDTTSPVLGIIRAAIGRGLDVIAVTNHDSADGYEVASRIRDRLGRRRKSDHHLTIVRAAEITAANNQHVLLFNLKRLPSVGLSLPRLLEEADRQGAFASMAHPELGDFSPTETDIEALLDGTNPLFSLEVHNGGAASIDKHTPLVDKYPRAFAVIKRRLPETGSNSRAKTIYENLKNGLQGATGGSDAHNARHVGDVVTCGPEGMDIFDAIRQGKSVVMEKRKLPRATATNILIGTVRSTILEGKRRSGRLKVLTADSSYMH